MAKRGQTALTSTVADRIVEATRKGLPRRDVAGIGGIHRRTLTKWLSEGAPDDDGTYPDTAKGKLAQRVDQAEAEWAQQQVETIEKHAKSGSPSGWQAAAWLLERRRPEDWARQSSSKLEVTGANGGPVELADAKARLLNGIDRLAK